MKVRIFTDGACSENPGPGGWGVVFNTASKCHTFSGNEQLTTNNRMELRAVIEAFKRIVAFFNCALAFRKIVIKLFQLFIQFA